MNVTMKHIFDSIELSQQQPSFATNIYDTVTAFRADDSSSVVFVEMHFTGCSFTKNKLIE
jgi:hypothetical protein